MILLWIIIPVFIAYSILIIYYWQSWLSVPYFKPAHDTALLKISVIIPARNEEQHIAALLDALGQQDYGRELIEIIVIDDHSTDNTASITRRYNNVKLLQAPGNTVNSYKKKAIETGIAAATGELIVATDADCLPPPSWLRNIVLFTTEKQAVFVAAPVLINCNASLVQMLQALDFMVLQGITAAVVHKRAMTMCNGANLAYQKKAFEEVNGFAGVDHIASGDDMLLMYKIWKKYPSQVHYLKSQDAIVATEPVKSWKEFFHQRIRWASKAKQYDDKRILPVLALVYLMNLSFLVLLIAGFWEHNYWLAAAGLWILKTFVEFPFFRSLCFFFNKQWAIKWFFFFQPLHILYIIVSGLAGQFGKYEWKGRRVS